MLKEIFIIPYQLIIINYYDLVGINIDTLSIYLYINY